MRAGPVIDSYNQIKFCPSCGITKVIPIGGHDDTEEFIPIRNQTETERNHREQNH